MSDSSSQPTADQDLDIPIIVHAPPSMGFAILYHEATKILLAQPESVIKTYLSLCAMSNRKRTAHPSLATLASYINMDRRTAIRSIVTLEELGLIEVKRPETNGRGRASDYFLNPPPYPEKKGDSPNVIGDIGEHQKGDIAMSPQQYGFEQERKNENDSSRTHARARTRESAHEDEGSNAGLSEGIQTSTGAPPSSSRGGAGVSNSDDWWNRDGGKMLNIFDHIWDAWPKHSYRDDAMAQWQTAFQSFLDNPETGNAFAVRLWKVVQWQLREWQKEEREPKYIPSLANWIKRGSWKDAPEEIR